VRCPVLDNYDWNVVVQFKDSAGNSYPIVSRFSHVSVSRNTADCRDCGGCYSVWWDRWLFADICRRGPFPRLLLPASVFRLTLREHRDSSLPLAPLHKQTRPQSFRIGGVTRTEKTEGPSRSACGEERQPLRSNQFPLGAANLAQGLRRCR